MLVTLTALGASPRIFGYNPVFSPGKEYQSLPGQLISNLLVQVRGDENHDDARQHIGEDVE